MTSVMKKNTKNSKMSLAEKRANMEVYLRKKKECEKQAQSIVEYLVENTVDEDWLLENIKFIHQSHYQDITEERAISKFCGYPICCKKIIEMPKQKFHISLKSNRVFDVTQRKNFCSNSCYEKSTHLHKQLLTSPLWLRDEEDIPKFTLLSNAKGRCGEEVAVRCGVTEREQTDEGKTSSLESSLTKLSAKDTKQDNLKCTARPKAAMSTNLDLNPVEVVTRTLHQWYTSTTKCYLFQGTTDDATKQILDQEKFQSAYKALCARLDFMELEEKVADERFLNEEKPQLKPMVSYEQLKKEMKKTHMRVRAFYGGQWDYAEESDDEEAEESKPGDEEGDYFVTPLVDATSQRALRRRVVMQGLEEFFPPLLFKIGLSFDDVQADLRSLVATFDLTPDTVTFRPNERSLLCFLLIELIAIKNPVIEERLQGDEGKRLAEEISTMYRLDDKFVRNVVHELLNK